MWFLAHHNVDLKLPCHMEKPPPSPPPLAKCTAPIWHRYGGTMCRLTVYTHSRCYGLLYRSFTKGWTFYWTQMLKGHKVMHVCSFHNTVAHCMPRCWNKQLWSSVMVRKKDENFFVKILWVLLWPVHLNTDCLTWVCMF